MWTVRPVASVVSALAGPLGLMARYAPSTSAETYLLQAPFAGNVLTTDREMWDYMRRQVAEVPDLALGGPSIGWLKAALRECAALAVMPAPKVPAICALGTVEKVVDVPPVHLRMAGWANGQLDLYPGAEHEIMMEGPAVRQRFFDRAAALFEAMETARCEAMGARAMPGTAATASSRRANGSRKPSGEEASHASQTVWKRP